MWSTDIQVWIEECATTITADTLPRVEGDRGQLRQVFQNLLSDAMEYCGDEPARVHVRAEWDGSKWCISVRDEGIGIDPDHQGRIFQAFQRLRTHDEHLGTGTGFAVCERIVERHGGRCLVDSEPSMEATVSFTVPVVENDEQ